MPPAVLSAGAAQEACGGYADMSLQFGAAPVPAAALQAPRKLEGAALDLEAQQHTAAVVPHIDASDGAVAASLQVRTSPQRPVTSPALEMRLQAAGIDEADERVQAAPVDAQRDGAGDVAAAGERGEHSPGQHACQAVPVASDAVPDTEEAVPAAAMPGSAQPLAAPDAIDKRSSEPCASRVAICIDLCGPTQLDPAPDAGNGGADAARAQHASVKAAGRDDAQTGPSPGNAPAAPNAASVQPSSGGRAWKKRKRADSIAQGAPSASPAPSLALTPARAPATTCRDAAPAEQTESATGLRTRESSEPPAPNGAQAVGEVAAPASTACGTGNVEPRDDAQLILTALAGTAHAAPCAPMPRAAAKSTAAPSTAQSGAAVHPEPAAHTATCTTAGQSTPASQQLNQNADFANGPCAASITLLPDSEVQPSAFGTPQRWQLLIAETCIPDTPSASEADTPSQRRGQGHAPASLLTPVGAARVSQRAAALAAKVARMAPATSTQPGADTTALAGVEHTAALSAAAIFAGCDTEAHIADGQQGLRTGISPDACIAGAPRSRCNEAQVEGAGAGSEAGGDNATCAPGDCDERITTAGADVQHAAGTESDHGRSVRAASIEIPGSEMVHGKENAGAQPAGAVRAGVALGGAAQQAAGQDEATADTAQPKAANVETVGQQGGVGRKVGRLSRLSARARRM